MNFDVLVVGGGPSGLSAALALGRARKRVLVCDAGPKRNAAAEQLQNFVTRDGTPPHDFRRIGREQLQKYENVQLQDLAVTSVAGSRGAFQVTVGDERIEARRILLATGMIDEMLPIEGYSALWGRSIFQCPYCHGWEVQGHRWGYLVGTEAAHLLPFALQARSWTDELTVFTNGAFDVSTEVRQRLEAVGVRLESGRVARLLVAEPQRVLEGVELDGGVHVPCDILFSQPPQRQVDLVRSLGLALDEHGYVHADVMRRETSIPGIYASGDLGSRMQAAIVAAASGMQAAAAINVDLMMG